MAEARLSWVSGPVLRARPLSGAFQVNEVVAIGEIGLLGEVIRLGREEVVIQVYEDTSGLRPGVVVHGSGRPLSVVLGPGLLGGIFDGLLRPLSMEDPVFIQPGAQRRPARCLRFNPRRGVGERLVGGAVLGEVRGSGGLAQVCLLPPDLGGELSWLAPPAEYPEDAPIARLRLDDGSERQVAMSHPWPVRQPRPVAQRLAPQRPMFTGQRIIDTLFPVARGGKAALPGSFGTGKTVLQQSLAKWCDADVIVYVGCGERGNELAGLLQEFPRLSDPRSGRPLLQRTVIIANTSNMPVAAREASIYTGVTVAEYFRDQGLHVALMADSTSRWAEALREVSGRLGELPGEGGYPAYLSSRLAGFYERAARVVPLGGGEGSVTLIGAVSPPSGDLSEPVTTHTKRYTRSYWVLDRARAQARFFPAIHPLQSYCVDVDELAGWWQAQGNPHWLAQRRRLLEILEEQARLERMARIVGADALPPRQQCVLLCGELINAGFLRQSADSPLDRHASPARQAAMLARVVQFVELALAAVAQGVALSAIRELPLRRRLLRMGEEIGEEQLAALEALGQELEQAFRRLGQASREGASDDGR